MALIHMTYLSQALLRTVELQVILPVDKFMAAGNDRESKDFKTLYLLHGLLGSSMEYANMVVYEKSKESKELEDIEEK